MAVFEAFVHDPLCASLLFHCRFLILHLGRITWGLLTVPAPPVTGVEIAPLQSRDDECASLPLPLPLSLLFKCRFGSSIGRPERRTSLVTPAPRVDEPAHAELNERALEVTRRIKDKLTGSDFAHLQLTNVTVAEQVALLIADATALDNLCQCYVGWCPFW